MVHGKAKKTDGSRAEGVAKEEKKPLQTRGRRTAWPGLRTNLWDGCFRAAVLQAAPSGSTTDVPNIRYDVNGEDTDVQTRDCARFKDKREFGRKSTKE